MSTNQTPTGGPSRRRRIAGERRPREDEATPSAPVEEAEPTGPTGPTGTKAPKPAKAPKPPKPPRNQEGADATPGRAVPTRVLAALAVAAVVLVAFAASGFGLDGVGLSAWRESRDQTDVAAATQSAPAAAERAAAAILAYDYKTLEADRDNAAKFMTSDYRKEYLDTFGLVLDNAPKLQAHVEAEVRASGVVHADPTRVEVLLFVNQVTTSTANEGEPQTALNRVRMTMEKQGGTWLVDGITSY